MFGHAGGEAGRVVGAVVAAIVSDGAIDVGQRRRHAEPPADAVEVFVQRLESGHVVDEQPAVPVAEHPALRDLVAPQFVVDVPCEGREPGRAGASMVPWRADEVVEVGDEQVPGIAHERELEESGKVVRRQLAAERVGGRVQPEPLQLGRRVVIDVDADAVEPAVHPEAHDAVAIGLQCLRDAAAAGLGHVHEGEAVFVRDEHGPVFHRGCIGGSARAARPSWVPTSVGRAGCGRTGIGDRKGE